MQPIKCGSSYLTERLLSFRNPLGTEVNWLAQPQTVDNHILLAGRRVATQLALPLLTLSALVESVVYPVFAAGASLASDCGVEIPLHFTATKWLDRASSAQFTVVWNIGNFFIFNLFCKHVFTQESLARYSLDQQNYWIRGTTFRLGVIISFSALYGFAVVCAPELILFLLVAVNTVPSLISKQRAQRECDENYVKEFLRQHPLLTAHLTGKPFRIMLGIEDVAVILALPNRQEQEGALRTLCENRWHQVMGQEQPFPPINIPAVLDEWLYTFGRAANIVPLNSDKMALGVKCFKDHILDAPDVDDNGDELSTKKRIRALDPETIPFFLMRIAYIYVWGTEKNSPVPDFFKLETRTQLAELRQNYGHQEVTFGNKFTSMQAFEGDPEEESQREIFKALREAVGGEINGGEGSFLNVCWFKAVTSPVEVPAAVV